MTVTRRVSRVLYCALASLLPLLLWPGGALALGNNGGNPAAGSDAAANLASQLTHWATAIIIPLASIVALPALFRRDVGHAFTVLMIVIVVGAFAWDPSGVATLVQNVANSIL
jgi:hypothetical protein